MTAYIAVPMFKVSYKKNYRILHYSAYPSQRAAIWSYEMIAVRIDINTILQTHN